MTAEPTLRLLSLGAGRQSTALFILGCEGKFLPKLDGAVFADTQWEPRHVMTHLANLQQFGEEHGVPVYLATKGSLPKDVLDPRVFATVPSWTKPKKWEIVPVEFGTCPACAEARISYETSDGALWLDEAESCPDCNGTRQIPVRWEKRLRRTGEPGAIKRQCTPKYKIEVINSQVRLLLGAQSWEEPCRYCGASGERIAPWDPEAGIGPCSICRGTGIRRRVGPAPKGAFSEQWIGFSLDEELDRVTTAGFPRYETPRFPLCEVRWTVGDCEKFLAERGWQAEKSACIGCPFHEDDIWIDMKRRDPEDFADAVTFDYAHREAPGLNVERYLHESREPLDIAVEKAERRMAARGVRLQMWGETPRKQPRGCSPYGCRAGEAA
ncbi:MAG TPA: hypothetical protein VGS62_06890 [Streptosporangiaceae bacterium]|nr:hypothetical protein [Streptosporangiaceae bacterium]